MKNICENYKQKKYRLQLIQAEIDELEEMIDSIGSKGDGIFIKGHISRTVENKAIILADKKRELLREQKQIVEIMTSIEKATSVIKDERTRFIVSQRNFKDLAFYEIGNLCTPKISSRQTRRIYSNGMKTLQEKTVECSNCGKLILKHEAIKINTGRMQIFCTDCRKSGENKVRGYEIEKVKRLNR